MATITRPSEPLPDPGDEMKAEQIRDWINNLLTFLETTNIDENNVDLTGTDGIVGKSTAQVITGAKTFESTAAAAGGVREVVQFGLDPASGTATDGDGGRFVLYADDDGGTETDIANIDWVFTDTSNGSEDSRIDLRALLAGTIGTVYTAGYSNTGAGTHELTVRDAAAANVLDAFIFEWEPDSGTALDNQGIALTFKLADDAGVQTTFATLDVVTTDVSDTTETAKFDFKLLNAGSEVTPFSISGSALTSGVNIVSDTDSTDDLGTTSVRWANLYVDSIGDTGQALTITAGANNINATAGTLALTGAQTISSTLGVTGLTTATGGITSGGNIVSDTDSTDDLGTSSVRWANVYTDSVGDIGQTLNLVGDATGIKVNSNIVSDTDSTDDLGTTTVRWANVYTDSIGDTGQDLTVAATTVNLPSGHIFDYNGADVTITHSANTLTLAGGTLTGTINPDASSVLANGVTATTQSASDNSTKVATTAYVETAVASGGAGAAFNEFLLIGA